MQSLFVIIHVKAIFNQILTEALYIFIHFAERIEKIKKHE